MNGTSDGAPPQTLDEVAEALGRRLLEAMPQGGVYGRVALSQLPEPVEHILRAALDRRVAREAALPDTEWVDADEPAVRNAARAWREAARDAARYPAAAWEAALTEAARQALHHLVDPAAASSAFCFAGEAGPLPVATVRARLTAFGPYPYLREIAARYVERKELETFDRGGLESLLRRIDKRMTSAFVTSEWDALAAPLFGLVGALSGLHGRVPADVLRRFFLARGAEDIAGAMAERPTWSPAELHDALVLALARPDDTMANETVDLAFATASQAAAPAPDDAPPRVAADPPAAAPPLWQSLAGAEGAGQAHAPEPPAAEPIWQALARTQQPAGAPARAETLANLEARVLGGDAIARRNLFIADIAGGSEAAYRTLLEELDAAPTWADAWPALARAFRENEVDIYGEAAVAITDAAEARFSGEG